MIQVRFKNMESSAIAINIVRERIGEAVARFPNDRQRTVVVTLGMENSPTKRGPDLFKVRAEIIGGRYHGLILEKEAPDLYKALANVSDGLLERLNRFSDRLRIKARKQRRNLSSRLELANGETEGSRS